MTYLQTLTIHAIRVSLQPNGKLRLEPDWLITDDVRQMVRKHRDELVAEIVANSVPNDPSAAIVPDYRFLMVATDLDSWEAVDPRFGYEIDCEPVYRMLDAPYYAWLRHRMQNARKAHDSGLLDDATFNVMRERFNVVHEWAVRHIGEDALRRAVRTTNVESYVSPSKHTFASYRKTWDDALRAYQQRMAQRCRPHSDQAATLEHMLATDGYTAIRSTVLNDVVLFVRDDSVAVPDKWADKVPFTMDELALVVGSAPEMLKQIHEVKRVFGGKVVPIEDSESHLFPETANTMEDAA